MDVHQISDIMSGTVVKVDATSPCRHSGQNIQVVSGSSDVYKRQIPYSKSSFTMDSSAGNGTKMMTAMGQGETQVSPYHMALITSAIANGGKLMKPYLVDKVTNASGAVMKETDQKEYKQLMTAEEAARIKEYMKSVVDYGTASVLDVYKRQ